MKVKKKFFMRQWFFLPVKIFSLSWIFASDGEDPDFDLTSVIDTEGNRYSLIFRMTPSFSMCVGPYLCPLGGLQFLSAQKRIIWVFGVLDDPLLVKLIEGDHLWCIVR